jgi:hypothetical protein
MMALMVASSATNTPCMRLGGSTKRQARARMPLHTIELAAACEGGCIKLCFLVHRALLQWPWGHAGANYFSKLYVDPRPPRLTLLMR